ncbi:MAG: hypothetical protein Q7U99_11910 [Rubrivivax sp.]|nr:hypothetical protein [Rubrivivax sp.]
MKAQPSQPGSMGYSETRDRWEALTRLHASAVRSLCSENDAGPVLTLQQAAIETHDRAPETTLYHLVSDARVAVDHYSSRHALFAFVVARLMAQRLDWGQADLRSIELAALTMNASMTQIQNRLATTERRPEPSDKAAIDRHAEDSAAVLATTSLAGDVCVEVVRLHHKLPPEGGVESWAAPVRLAAALRRADMFTAKLSRRGARSPTSPLWAAREVCLSGKTPDMLGAALLKSLGLYPAGTMVELINREVCIVVRQTERADKPVVAMFIDDQGVPSVRAGLRSTSAAAFAVKRALASSQIRQRPPHERIFPS